MFALEEGSTYGRKEKKKNKTDRNIEVPF